MKLEHSLWALKIVNAVRAAATAGLIDYEQACRPTFVELLACFIRRLLGLTSSQSGLRDFPDTNL
jgi:hypothetical protein